MRFLVVMLLSVAALSGTAAAAEPDKPLTNGQCIDVLAGLDAMRYVGEPLSSVLQPQPPIPLGALHYHFGSAVLIAMADDSWALHKQLTILRDAQSRWLSSNPEPKAKDKAFLTTEAFEAADKAWNDAANKNWSDSLAAPCPLTLTHLKLSDLRPGDAETQNAFPVQVFTVLLPIIDRDAVAGEKPKAKAAKAEPPKTE